MSTIREEYERRLASGNDICELMPVLRYFASHSLHVVEFGVRTGNSTFALLMGEPVDMLSVDLVRDGATKLIEAAIAESRAHTKWTFREADDRTITIPETDLLFIDTEHKHEQLAAELNRHAAKVRRWILLHDTETFGDELNPAIEEFLTAHNAWTEAMRLRNCNGLTLLERNA